MSRSQRTSVSAAFFVIPAVSLLLACFALWQGIFTDPAHAAPPPTTMNFQGRLADSSGNLMPDGLYNMQFRLFSVSTGGSAVWTETRENNGTDYRVQVTNGLFSTQLGEANALSASLFNATNLYFEITMATPGTATCSTASCATWESPMTPRHKLATSAYAFNAASLNGYTEADFAAASGSANYIQNGTSPQTADFNITGTGTAATLQASTFDRATSGTLTIGGANATTVSLADDTTIASGKTLRVVGDTSTNIIGYGSPTEGQMTYDQTNGQLLVYSETSPGSGTYKWKADKSDAILVAASNSSQADKNAADYVADGEDSSGAGIGALDGDQIQINQALTAAAGKKVILLAGTYTVDASISIPNNTTLAGVGNGTLIQLGNFGATLTNINMIINTDTTTGQGVVVRDMQLDGRKTLNTNGTMRGIYYNRLNQWPGNLLGGKIVNTIIKNLNGTGLYLDDSSKLELTGSTLKDNTVYGLYDYYTAYNNYTSNTISGNGSDGIYIDESYYSNINDNIFQLNGNGGIRVADVSLVIADNVFEGNQFGITGTDIYVSTISGNSIRGGISGISLTNSWNVPITNNHVYGTSSYGIRSYHGDTNTISNNTIWYSGGTTQTDAIYINQSDNNVITGNVIRDGSCTTTCYGINISNATSDNNYLADNRMYGPSAQYPATINDAGTGTIYANQTTTANQILQSSSSLIKANASTTLSGTADPDGTTTLTGTSTYFQSELQVGDRITVNAETRTVTAIASDTSLTVNTAFSDTASASITRLPAALVIQGSSGTNTVEVSDIGTVKFQNSTDSTAGFQVQNAAGAALLNVDTTTGSVQVAGALDTTTATTLNIGSTNATSINLNQNTVLATGKSLKITGSGTRPGSPTAGMVYYDTTTNQLLTYNGSKWMSDRSTATVIVAADNSKQSSKDGADFTVSTAQEAAGNADAAITAAIATLPAGGGTVYLAEGTYTIDTSIDVPVNTTIAGAGNGTIIKLADGIDADFWAIVGDTADDGITLRDFSLDGNSGNQASGNMTGIDMTGVNDITITNIFAHEFTDSGIALDTVTGASITDSVLEYNWSTGLDVVGSSNVIISGNRINESGWVGIYAYNMTDSTLVGNDLSGNDQGGIYMDISSNNAITGNTVNGDTGAGIRIEDGSNNNLVASNRLNDNGGATTNDAILIDASDSNTITGNSITDASCSSTCYAINILNSTSDDNYLANNTLGGGIVNDNGTDTIYGGQSDGTSYRIQPATGVLVGKVGGGSISAFQVQDANGDALLNVNSTSNYVINNGISAPGNFAQNPGFEAGAYTESDPDRASGWKLYGGAYTANDSANARSGNHELVIPAYASGVDAESKYYEVTPGDSYFVSLYVKATGSPNQDAGLLVTFYDKDKSATVYDGSYNSVPTASYTKKSVNGQVPAGAAFMRIIPTVRSQASPTGTYYFDDVFARITSDRAPYFNADSTTAFQVQNAAGTNILNIGTTNSTVLQNIATNGGAESGGSGWSARSGTTGPTISTTYYNTGDQSVYFGTNASGEGANYPITLSSTTTYTATFMARVSAGSGNILDFGYASDGATETNCKSSQSVPNTTGWRLQNCTFTTGTVSGSPYFYIKVNNSTARTLYIDSFQIVAGSNAGPYSEGTINTSALFQRSVAIAPTNDSSSALSVQTAGGIGVFSVDTNTKRVGIGLDKPAALLHVSAVTPDEDLLRLQASGVTVMDVAYTGATSFRNHTNSTAAFQIQNAAGSAQLSLGTTAPSNIISNGNFETDSVGSLPSSWTAKGSATVQASNTVAWMGGQSMSIAATAANTGVQYATTLTVGNYYAVSLMAKAASSAFSNLNVGYTNGGGDQVACTNQYVSTTWTRIDCAFQVTSTNGTQLFITQNDSTSRTFYIDGVSVTQVANAGVLAPVYAESILKTSSKFDSPLIVAPTESSNLAFVVQSNSAHYNVPVLSVSTADDAVGIMTTGFESGVDLTFGAYDDRVVAVATNWSGAGNSLTIRGGNAGNGNSNGGDLVLQGGDRNGTGTAGSVIVKSQTDSTTAFQIQNNAGNSLFNVDTTTARGLVSVALGNTASTNAVCSSLANTTSPTANTAYELRDCSSAPAADYAEMYSVEQGIEYGDIVAVGTELVNTYDQKDGNIDWTKVKGKVTKLVKTSTVGQTNVIGIVSDNYGDFTSAGYNIKQQDNPMPVALNGRVPVKVASSSLPIMPGDYITTSNEPGKAQKASKAGMVIGKALETWTSASGQQMVMVYVEQGYYPGPTQLANNLVQNGGDANLATLIANTANIVNVNVSGQTTLKDLTVDGDSTFSGKLTVQDIEVQNIVIKGHIKTAGETPTITVGEAAGEKDPLNGIEAPHVTVEGNDTAGTITVVAGANTGSGLVAEVQFNSAFDNKPRAVLSAKNIQSSKLQIFNITDENKLQISSTSNLTAGEIYIFDYIIIQ